MLRMSRQTQNRPYQCVGDDRGSQWAVSATCEAGDQPQRKPYQKPGQRDEMVRRGVPCREDDGCEHNSPPQPEAVDKSWLKVSAKYRLLEERDRQPYEQEQGSLVRGLRNDVMEHPAWVG